MTEKFKELVKAVVLDGEITEQEIAALKELAEKDNIDKNEAALFITAELKKRKEILNIEPSFWEKYGDRLIFSALTIGLAFLENKVKGNNSETGNNIKSIEI